LTRVVGGINALRAKHPNGQFHHLGDLLGVPELTFRSPFLSSAAFDPEKPAGREQVFDSDYERIPQQVLSLLKLGEPRFVVYSGGQSPNPARGTPTDTGPSSSRWIRAPRSGAWCSITKSPGRWRLAPWSASTSTATRLRASTTTEIRIW